MNKPLKSEAKVSSPSIHPLERLFNEMKAGSHASGRTVTVIEPTDSSELRATLPQGRRPAVKQTDETPDA